MCSSRSAVTYWDFPLFPCGCHRVDAPGAIRVPRATWLPSKLSLCSERALACDALSRCEVSRSSRQPHGAKDYRYLDLTEQWCDGAASAEGPCGPRPVSESGLRVSALARPSARQVPPSRAAEPSEAGALAAERSLCSEPATAVRPRFSLSQTMTPPGGGSSQYDPQQLGRNVFACSSATGGAHRMSRTAPKRGG